MSAESADLLYTQVAKTFVKKASIAGAWKWFEFFDSDIVTLQTFIALQTKLGVEMTTDDYGYKYLFAGGITTGNHQLL